MQLLVRLMGWVLGLVVNILRWAIRKVWEYIGHVLRILLPLLPRVVWGAIVVMAFAISVLFAGVGRSIDTMAFEWTGRALEHRWPQSTERFLYWLFYVLAGFTILLGWVMIAFTVVYIVQLAFGR